MKTFLISISIGLGLGLVAAAGIGPAAAQNGRIEGVNTTGNCVTYGTPGNWTVSCGDIHYSPGQAITVAPTVDTSYAPGDSGVRPVPVEPAPVTEPVAEPVTNAPAEPAALGFSEPERIDSVVSPIFRPASCSRRSSN